MITKLIVEIDLELKKKFVLKATKENKTQKEVVTELLEKYVKEV